MLPLRTEYDSFTINVEFFFPHIVVRVVALYAQSQVRIPIIQGDCKMYVLHFFFFLQLAYLSLELLQTAIAAIRIKLHVCKLSSEHRRPIFMFITSKKSKKKGHREKKKKIGKVARKKKRRKHKHADRDP